MTDARGPVIVPPRPVCRDAARLRWGTVSTVKAPLPALARFAAHHIELGAARVTLCLDDPQPEVIGFFAGHPIVQVHACDAAWWDGVRDKARSTHQRRQAHNATRVYRTSDLDWLAHIDVDEFLLPAGDMATLLAAQDETVAALRVRPAEQLSTADGTAPAPAFKLTRRHQGHKRAVLADIFPEFGPHLGEGHLSYFGGKAITRTGLAGLRIGLHSPMRKGARVANCSTAIDSYVLHAHAATWAGFERHLAFRMSRGSYRASSNGNKALNGVIEVLCEAEGTAGLRRLYDELQAARPDLLARLDRYGMLLRHDLQLDAKVARQFGALPGHPA